VADDARPGHAAETLGASDRARRGALAERDVAILIGSPGPDVLDALAEYAAGLSFP